MRGPSQLLLLALTVSVTLILADYRPPGDFYLGDKPIWPVPKECPAEDSKEYTVHLAHESDCTKFYKCLRGKKILMECPLADAKGNKLHFNRILQVCDWPERAMCADNSWTTWIPGGTTVSIPDDNVTSGIPKDCKAQPDGTNVENPEYCYLYFECINKKEVLRECPEGLQFYPEKQVCDFPDGTCDQIKPVICPPAGIMFVPHECCNRVYICSEGTLIPLNCGNELHWNMEIRNCTTPEEAKCVSGKIC